MKNIFDLRLLSFLKYLNFSEAQKNGKLLMARSYFRRKEIGFKSVTKTLYRNKSLVSECTFKLVVTVRVADYQRLVVHKRYR